MKYTIHWFNQITERLRDNPEGEMWTNGDCIFCKTEDASKCIADMLKMLYDSQNEFVSIITGYYDPKEDKRNDEEDIYTGWWYVTLD
jgi:hypothetical protein